MGRSRYSFGDPGAPHFMTSTILDWTPVFTRPDTVDIVLDSFRFLQGDSGLKIYGYVILENHLHWIAQSDDLPSDVKRFKSYTARKIVDYLEEYRIRGVLEKLAYGRKRHKSDCDYQVWEEGSHPQEILNGDMLRQKLDYIHMNPVKRGYVDEPTCWRYSSARNYAGREGLIGVYRDWFG